MWHFEEANLVPEKGGALDMQRVDFAGRQLLTLQRWRYSASEATVSPHGPCLQRASLQERASTRSHYAWRCCAFAAGGMDWRPA